MLGECYQQTSADVHQVMGYADAQRPSINRSNNKSEGRLTLCTPSFCSSDYVNTVISDKEAVMRMTLPPCDVGSRSQSSKRRRASMRLVSARYRAHQQALLTNLIISGSLLVKTSKLKAKRFNQCEVSSYESP